MRGRDPRNALYPKGHLLQQSKVLRVGTWGGGWAGRVYFTVPLFDCSCLPVESRERNKQKTRLAASPYIASTTVAVSNFQ